MRATVSLTASAASWYVKVRVPSGEFAGQRPALHVAAWDQGVVLFLTVDEVEALRAGIDEHLDALRAADAEWVARAGTVA